MSVNTGAPALIDEHLLFADNSAVWTPDSGCPMPNEECCEKRCCKETSRTPVKHISYRSFACPAARAADLGFISCFSMDKGVNLKITLH